MAYKKIDIHAFNLDNRIKLLEDRISSDKEFKSVMEHLRLLSLGEITGKEISEKRQRKLIDMFTIFFRYYNKETNKLTKEDLRKFKQKLLNNEIKKINGSPYADHTKEDLTETIARYLEWKFPKKIIEFSNPNMTFRKWFVIRAKNKTPEVLSEVEIEKLFEASKTIEGKFLISVLFGAGCRIEEFLNLRFEDIEEPTKNFPYYRFDFKEEYSKTKGRKIGLYWKNCTETISKYLASCEKKNQSDVIFPKEYDAVRMFLGRLGKKVLNKKVTPHMFRKSSATFYADKLNRQELCIRYGWQFSSSMPDIYISRAGLDEEKLKDRIITTDLGEVHNENRELKTKQKLQEEEIERLKANEKKTSEMIVKLANRLEEIKNERGALLN